VLAALRQVAAALPVAITVRPPRGALLHETYGFEGAESDLRALGGLPAAALSPHAARMILLAGIGAGAGPAALAAALDG
jgi:L-asparaginase/Glu-tRNA(Gln) amidotransferase subunit D